MLTTLEITPGMIEAGILAARGHPLGLPLRDLVVDVYLAMRLEESKATA